MKVTTLENEVWYGLAVSEGTKMPVGKDDNFSFAMQPVNTTAAFPVRYGIRPYILSPDKVENVGRGLDPSARRRGRRFLQ